ncbi:MAG: right-handed parallel beta-helix repeat-containing protein [Nitriliruptoraceae bacterium]
MRKRGRTSARVIATAAMLIVAVTFIASPAAATGTITVTTTTDGDIGDPGIGCPAGDDDVCTLRAAIATAESGDTIQLPDGTLHLADEIVITSSVRIVGESRSATVIEPDPDGSSPHRLFTIDAPGANVAFQDLALARGQSPDTKTPGAALRLISDAQVSILSVLFDANDALTDNVALAGAIYVGPHEIDLTVSRSRFRRNVADAGGALFVDRTSGSIRIADSHFAENEASAFGGTGGALHVSSAPAIVEIDSATFDENQAQLLGGAILVEGSSRVEARRSTFTSNLSGSGASLVARAGSSIEVTNSSFLANTASTAGGVLSTQSGGNSATLRFVTITDDASAFDVADGSAVDLQRSALQNTSGCANVAVTDTFADATSSGNCGTTSVADLRLSDAVSGGYLTPMHGSPILDAFDADCQDTDQRGRARSTPCAAGAVDTSGITCPSEIPRSEQVTCELDVAIAADADVRVEINPVLFDNTVSLDAGIGTFAFSVPPEIDEDTLRITAEGDGQTYVADHPVAAPPPTDDDTSSNDGDPDPQPVDPAATEDEELPDQLAMTGAPLVELTGAGVILVASGVMLWRTMGREKP